jgi:hypothetical protein
MVAFEHLKALLDVAGDDMERRDHALHLIFTEIINSSKFKKEDIAAQLFRLYYVDAWLGARTFFCILTGVMLDEDVSDDEDYQVTVFFRGKGYFSFDLQTIVETCYDNASGLNELYFAEEEEHSDDEEGSEYSDDDFFSTDEEEEESESELEPMEPEVPEVPFARRLRGYSREQIARYLAYKAGQQNPE